jgi:hypothetical protein
MVLGQSRSEPRIPEAWISAATKSPPESLAVVAYRRAAMRCGIEPLSGAALIAQRSQHVMGLYRRAELRAASERTLEAIRSAIPSDTVRARFDEIFRPQGEWVVDLHDAALEWARGRAPGISWGAARPALSAAHFVGSEGKETEAESTARALYGLAVLAATDSNAFAQARASFSRADSGSATAVLLLLTGYAMSRRWYIEALDFLLRQPWIPEQGGASVQDLVTAEWRSVLPSDGGAPLPRIESRWFGYPQAVPRYGIPAGLFDLLIRPENAAGSEWLRREGQGRLLRTLHWLPPGDTSLTLLRTSATTLRLSTVPRQSRESLNGFLEPDDAIAIDPGYSPLLALGTLVHEWQHLLFRRRQLERYARSPRRDGMLGFQLPGVQPYLAEGFAEWSSERILRPVTDRWPLLALGELEKRADLNRRTEPDQHALGYALVGTLFSVLKNPRQTTELLLRHAEDPEGIAEEPALRRAWSAYRSGERERKDGTPGLMVLIPEVTFTVEDNYPDVVTTRILVPSADDTDH